ncbi:phosphate ABC transporter substrate-binding protein PstS [Niveibacterium sp. SC-1]|uniref:phosphate ABC transporter substrate-binding protein PstS n=1 Tax=Niveibacterium sp. SC-1 TaxID=3135646 RepID=UPI00311D7B71
MKKSLGCWVAGAALFLVAPLEAAEVTGAGASSPGPVYLRWAAAYKKATGNTINYQSIGSGGGVKEVGAKSVDFGASDIPLSEAELQRRGLVQFPVLVGAAVPFVNLPGIKAGEIRLTGPLLADIYEGRITRWDDPRIAEVNGGVSLPAMSIIVVRRGDGAGVSFLFTHYLGQVSASWKENVGEGVSVPWPAGLGGKGDEGVMGFVKRLPGAIGYVEYGYARRNDLAYVQLQDRNGKFVDPTEASLRVAAEGAAWDKTAYGEVLTNQGTAGAWPIAGASFILLQQVQDKPAQANAVLQFFDWSLAEGGKIATEAGYVPLSASTASKVSMAWQRIKDGSGKTVELPH